MQDDQERRLGHRQGPPIALAQPSSPTVPLASDLEAAKQEDPLVVAGQDPPLVAGQDPAVLGQDQPDQEIRTQHCQVKSNPSLLGLLVIF